MSNKDIGQFKSLGELSGRMQNIEEPELTARQKERQMRKAYKDAELIWQDDKWQVWYPQNWDAACTLGKGTSWCTADSRTAKFYVYYTSGGYDSDYFFRLADLGDQINNKDGIKWLCQDLEMDEELKQELLSLDYKEALNRIISIYSEEYSKDCVVEWIDDWAGMHDPHEITTYDNATAPLFVFINKQYPNHKWQLWCGDMDGDDWWNVENWHFADINDNMRNFEDEAWHDRSFADFAIEVLGLTMQDIFQTPPPWDDEYEEVDGWYVRCHNDNMEIKEYSNVAPDRLEMLIKDLEDDGWVIDEYHLEEN